MEKMIKMRDTMREAADLIDDLIAMQGREEAGEEVKAESERIIGAFMIAMVKLQSLQ